MCVVEDYHSVDENDVGTCVEGDEFVWGWGVVLLTCAFCLDLFGGIVMSDESFIVSISCWHAYWICRFSFHF